MKTYHCVQASLQLLEISNLSPFIGRLRRHADIRVASKAEQLAQRWHAIAAAVYTHAKQHLDMLDNALDHS
jgi:hypothetical protein